MPNRAQIGPNLAFSWECKKWGLLPGGEVNLLIASADKSDINHELGKHAADVQEEQRSWSPGDLPL